MTDAIILVVDDTASARATVAAQLESCDYALLFVDSAKQARAAIAKQRPDVILLDVNMPETDGITFCKELRSDPLLARVPVVLVTALDSREDITRGLAAGANEFLSKPTHGAELRARLANILGGCRYTELLERQHEAALEEVAQLRDQLLRMDRLATLGTFAAGVGHELNNIALVLSMYSAEALRSLDRGEAVSRGDIEALAAASEHVTKQGKSILELGAPRAMSHRVLVDVCQVVRWVTETLSMAGRIKHLTVKLDMPSEPVLFLLHKVELEQILINLCANAADALQGTTGSKRLEVSIRPGDEDLVILVRDNGPGMSAEVLERVFDAFYTTKPVGKGTGLGLPVIKRLVESYGGTVHIETAPSCGTAVTITLRKCEATVA